MNFQQFIIVLLSSFVFISCQEETKKKPPTPKPTASTKKEAKPVTIYAKYPIHFIKSSLELPNVFQPVNAENLTKIIEDSYNHTPRQVQNAERKLFLLNRNEGDQQSIILEDTSDVENNIVIDVYPFSDFNKQGAGLFMGQLDETLKNNFAEQNPDTRVERVEGRYFQNVEARMIKIKYKINEPGIPTYYLTQYILNFFIKQKMLSIAVQNTDLDDFEEPIKLLEAKF